jgi:hypothetical protein
MVSVNFGPLCINRAIENLEFIPTPLADAVQMMLSWFENPNNRKYTRTLDESSSSSGDRDTCNNNNNTKEEHTSSNSDNCSSSSSDDRENPKENIIFE